MAERGHGYPIVILLLSVAAWTVLWQAWRMFR